MHPGIVLRGNEQQAPENLKGRNLEEIEAKFLFLERELEWGAIAFSVALPIGGQTRDSGLQ